jgi:hypothetical protein
MLGRISIFLLLASLAAVTPAVAQSDCAGAINQLRTVVDNDVATGNLNRSVYAQMQPGLAQAAGLCRAGHPSEALRALQNLKHRYGYR